MTISDISDVNNIIPINDHNASCGEHCVQRYLASWQSVFSSEATGFSAFLISAIENNLPRSGASFVGELGISGHLELEQ
jgi:hypothetical protein